jgi:hypothetical protein
MSRARCLIPILALLLPIACGSRSGLLSAGDGASGAGDAATIEGRRDGALARDLVRPDLSPRALCPEPLTWKEPHPILTYPDRHGTAPSLALVDPGEAGAAARIAIQVFASGGSSSAHSAIEVARVRIGTSWPSGLVLEMAPLLWGVESHGWGELARAPGPTAALALAWHSDQGGKGRPVFRTLAVEAWTPGPIVDLAASGEAVLDLAAGQGLIGSPGYAVVWRDVQQKPGGGTATRPLVGVLGADGALVHGPFPAAAADGYPGRSPRIVWSGTHYLTATAFSACIAGDPQCSERSVVVARVSPAGMKTDPLVPVAKLQSLEPTTRPRRAAIAVYAGAVFVAWAEGGVDEQALLSVRLARLSPAGALAEPPRIVATGVRPLASVSLDATALGLILSWPEQGDPAIAPDKPGRSAIVVHWLDGAGQPLHPAARLPSPLYHTYGSTSAVAIEQPRALLLAWGGRLASGLDGAYLAAGLCAP